MKKTPENWQVYVITNEVLSGRTHLEIAQQAVEGGADVIQFRDKTIMSRILYDTAKAIKQLADEMNVAFIINDRLDIAQAVDADGVHLGQDDLPLTAARKILGPDKIIGGSATNRQEALQVQKAGADYMGVGAIFEARNTKPDASGPRGVSLITEIRELVKIPIVAIGGINRENAAEVMEAGADGVAVISDIVTAEDIAGATREMKQIVNQAILKRGEANDGR